MSKDDVINMFRQKLLMEKEARRVEREDRDERMRRLEIDLAKINEDFDVRGIIDESLRLFLMPSIKDYVPQSNWSQDNE
jgi:hypothetical protein